MKVIFYKITDGRNVMGKTLKDGTEYNVNIKGEIALSKLNIILKSNIDIINKYNYVYIPMFNRYYFITKISSPANQVFQFDLEVDVLESFKDDIKNSRCLIVKQDDINPYYNISYDSEVRKECRIVESNKEIELENSNILVTIGG